MYMASWHDTGETAPIPLLPTAEEVKVTHEDGRQPRLRPPASVTWRTEAGFCPHTLLHGRENGQEAGPCSCMLPTWAGDSTWALLLSPLLTSRCRWISSVSCLDSSRSLVFISFLFMIVRGTSGLGVRSRCVTGGRERGELALCFIP